MTISITEITGTAFWKTRKTRLCRRFLTALKKEWGNGLEGWITAELTDGRRLTFFDADYAINKGTYEIGKSYDFVIGALAYRAEEPESKGFKFEGQQAIDFKAKLGEEPEYDENGNVKPVEFSTATLCAFLQVGHAPDEEELR